MNRISLDLSRRALITNIGIAALATVGIISLMAGQSLVAVPALLAVSLVIVTREVRSSATPERGEATRDPLTGLATAAVGVEALAREFAAAQRGRPLSIVLIRLEGLPKYRVRHGKTVASHLLRVTGRILAEHRRGMHLTALHGGREGTFVSILSASDREGASVYAARIRRALMRVEGLPAHEGVSVGVASFDLSMASPTELVRRAEFALAKGGEAGGRVVVMGESA